MAEATTQAVTDQDDTLLKVENLTVRFAVKRGGLFSKKSYLYAVDDVSFAVKRGETLATHHQRQTKDPIQTESAVRQSQQSESAYRCRS